MMKKCFKSIVVGIIATISAMSVCGFTHVSGGGNPEDWEFDNTQYVFDYAASRYERETMTAFQNLFRRVVATIVNNANTDGYDFEQLKKDVCGNRGLKQSIKAFFPKK